MKSRLHVFAALAVAATITFVIASAVNAASNPGNGKPHAVLTASDNGKSKLDAKLQDALESSSTATVPVFVTATDGVPAIEALLTDAHAATRAGNAIVIGKINVQQLPKLGSIDGVVSVGSVDFEQTGEPLGVDPDINKQPSLSTLQSTANTLRKQEVSYANAPALKGSNFEALKNLNVLDAKTHRFADAWKAGFDGAGTVGSVLDGGTDWGHPDLIGTWKTWTNAPDPGWNGWPMAFDPFGTLQLLLAPGQIDQGLSWYTKTQAQTSFGSVASNASLATVSFATRTGPSRNFSAPDGKNTHTYSFPKAWAAGGKVWLGSHPDDHLLQLFGERPAYLLVDSNKDGQGDTLYVDLDDDYQFGDEKPVTKGSPVSYRDMNGDGYVDLSGGLAYFIADGTTTVPGGQLDFGGEIVPDANSLVAWTGDFDPAIEGHGTLTASNVVGQGVINGKAPTFSDLPGDGKYPGAVIGGAPKARLAPMGDIYFSFDFSTQFGYLLTAGYGVDVTSNSYGNSDNDNDGYDAASQEAGFLNAVLNGGRTTPVFSTGNGAPGYGTATAPRPFNGISVGASTQFGGTGWDSVAKLANIPDNDVVLWSNRGPGAPGSTGVDVVADGAYSPGDATLNSVLDGRNAWETWGGTSRSTPVTVGATLLAYQAFAQANGGAKPTNAQARRIIKSSAQDLRYDAWTQGAGSVDAKRATEIATSGGTVSPDAWRAGSYRGVSTYPTFTNLVAPGGSSSRSFSVTGSGTYSVSDRYLVRSAHVTKSFTSSDVNNESESNFNAPDYLMNITSEVQAHSDADLMVVRANFPYDKFDGNGDYVPDQKWRLLTYKWNDVNGDGRLWQDTDGNGAVRHPAIATNSSIDAGFADVNYNAAEIEKGEYVRFQYHRPDANTLISFVRQPAQRMADGLFLGFQHNVRSKAIPTTSFDIEIDFYKQVDWPWLSTPATVNAPGTFSATLNVPGDAAYGMYEGAIVLTKNGRDQVVPVSATVGATLPQDAAGNVTGTLDFGGASVANAQAGQLYNNGAVFGATDWSWRAESGDWRFFYYDALKAPPAGTLLLADTSWADGVPTDIDTLLFGRSANSYQLVGGSGSLIGDPYILDTIGKSPNTNTGAGIWKFNTATGGSRDIVSGPAQEGLGAVAWHQVNFKGDQFYTPVKTTLGAAQVAPSAVAQTTSADTGSFDVTFKANVDLTGLKSEAFGLSQPTTENVQVKQDNPDVSSTASVKRNITLHHASKLQVNFDLATDDNDLFVLRDANGDGQFTSNEIVASSTSGSSHEAVTLVKPADGAYQIWVHGFSVAGTPTGALKIDAIQGDDLTVTGVPAGAVPAGTLVTLHVAYSKAMTAGQYFGELLLGPNEAPAALRVPITVTRS